jgi:selenophosphate synthetase-related protein
VAHKHQTTIEALDSVSQGVDGLQVKMVGGLCCTYKQKQSSKLIHSLMASIKNIVQWLTCPLWTLITLCGSFLHQL